MKLPSPEFMATVIAVAIGLLIGQFFLAEQSMLERVWERIEQGDRP
jgi:uncharacterized membrane protein YqgA involved in biofilm formation